MVKNLDVNKLENCLRCKKGGFPLLFTDFVYFDVKGEGMSKKMLFDGNIKMWSLKKASCQEEPYEMYMARVWNKDVTKFVEVMDRLEKRILFAGHANYVDYCKKVFDKFKGDAVKAPERT